MSKATIGTGLCLLGLPAMFAFCFQTVSAQEPKGSEKNAADKLSFIVGMWDNEVRHAVHADLYQSAHGARLRESVIRFKRVGDQLVGYSLLPHHTTFRVVTFAKGQLVFEFDINELHHGWGHLTKSKGWIRVEAQLKGDRLIGKWGLFEEKSGTELFRGEWEAVRAKQEVPGAVVIAGGGELPDAARDEFFKLAGVRSARIVVIPTAQAQDNYTGKEEFLLQPWQALNSESVQILHTRDRKTADDPAFIKPLTKATAVWFSNGHTDRLLNAYQGTKVEAELKKLLERGGVVGGKDAGAVVFAERVHQRFDPDVLSQGYGLLSGVMMARGFGDPDRADRAVLDRNPQYAGIGIPNDTAAIISGPSVHVVGKGPVRVYWPKSSAEPARHDEVPTGAKYNLKERKASK